ncbi:MAG TPA: glycine zipper 2TM domain-containing protein [Sulfuricurvum sp.]|nr:glycine zipper 2TM domain-containing protein [Sulfuricurvum sp.]
MKMLATVVFASMVMLGGCAQSGVPIVDSDASKYILTAQSGVITDVKAVVVKGSGGGAAIGGISGAVIGSTMGGGRGSVLTMLGGGLVGLYAGSEIEKSNAQELSVTLDDKQEVIVISKGTEFRVGQRVKIVKRNGQIYNVELAK